MLLITREYGIKLTGIAENYVNGKAFLRLSEPDVRKIVPPIGLTKKICTLIPKVHNDLFPVEKYSEV